MSGAGTLFALLGGEGPTQKSEQLPVNRKPQGNNNILLLLFRGAHRRDVRRKAAHWQGSILPPGVVWGLCHPSQYPGWVPPWVHHRPRTRLSARPLTMGAVAVDGDGALGSGGLLSAGWWRVTTSLQRCCSCIFGHLSPVIRPGSR